MNLSYPEKAILVSDAVWHPPGVSSQITVDHCGSNGSTWLNGSQRVPCAKALVRKPSSSLSNVEQPGVERCCSSPVPIWALEVGEGNQPHIDLSTNFIDCIDMYRSWMIIIGSSWAIQNMAAVYVETSWDFKIHKPLCITGVSESLSESKAGCGRRVPGQSRSRFVERGVCIMALNILKPGSAMMPFWPKPHTG